MKKCIISSISRLKNSKVDVNASSGQEALQLQLTFFATGATCGNTFNVPRYYESKEGRRILTVDKTLQCMHKVSDIDDFDLSSCARIC